MVRRAAWLVAVLSALGILLVSGYASAAPETPKQSSLSVYTVASGPQVFAQYGVRSAKGIESPSARLDPLILRLAREGRAQNIRPMPDGSVRLLIDSTGANLLRDDGSSVSAVAPVRSAAASQPLTTTLAGTVTAVGGSGISGAVVSAILGTGVVTTTTAANGSYSLQVSGTGDYQVGVYAAGYEWQPSVLVASPPGATNINFALVPQNLTITGHVSNAGGPIAGAIVHASDLSYDNFTAGDSTTTDASGNYTLTVSASTYEVRAFAPPLGVKSLTAAVPPSATGKNFVFGSPTLYTVSGVVRKSNGQPLPAGELTFSSNYVPINSCDAPFVQAPTAGADGSYSVQLPAGSYSVYANWSAEWSDHWVIGASAQLNVSGNVSNFDVTLPAIGTITGTVRDPNGQPLANARVFSWRGDPNASPWFDGFFSTDAGGNYILTATLGVHNLVAFSDTYTNSAVRNVNLTSNLTGINMQVTTGRLVGGTLMGSDNRPLSWASLSYLTGQTGAQFNRYATIYYDGTWKAYMTNGQYTLNVSQASYVGSSRNVNVNQNTPPINFTLTRKTLKLTGHVNIVTGSGLCDTYMTASDVTTQKSTVGNTSGNGDYVLLLAPGTYNVFPYKYNSNSPSFNSRVTIPPLPASVNFTVTEIIFRDVMTDTYYFEPIGYLIYNNIASGYSDGTYRPFNNTTRGQLAKLIVNAQQWAIDTSGGPHFSDVQPDNPFYGYIETAYHHNAISGYSDGTFRWGNNITRAQLSKVIVLSAGWSVDTSGGPHFADVAANDPFYAYIETAFNRGIISGYADGTFRPGANATRGQIAKIVYNAVTQP